MNNINALTGGSISRALLQLACPILCSNILFCVSDAVSAFWVGRYLGEAALAAVTNVQSILIVLSGVASGITMAATILAGQCMGADDVGGAKRVVGMGMIFFFALSIVLTLLGLAFTTPLLMAIRTPLEALPLAVPYMRVMLLALPSMYLVAFVMSLLIGIGDSTTPLRFVLLSVVLAALFTPVFMFVGDVVLGAGVIGAALATFAAQAVCLLALLRHLYRRRHPLCLTRQDVAIFVVDWSIVRELVRKGIPMGAQAFVLSFSSLLMIELVNRFGVDTTAAYGVLMRVWAYVMMPALAISIAVSTMAAQNIGAQNWGRVRRTALIGMGYSFSVTAAIVAVVYVADSHVYRLFLPEGSAAFPIAGHVNRIVTWSLIFLSIPLVLFGVMRAAGAVMVPLLVHVVSLLIVRYPLAAMLLDGWHADAIWWSFTASHGVDVVLAVLYYRYSRHWLQRSYVGDRSERTGSDSQPAARPASQ